VTKLSASDINTNAQRIKAMKASARKSYGEYKPVIIYDNGRTEICGQRGYNVFEYAQTQFGYSSIRWVAKRGLTFKLRAEAVDFAQRDIEHRQQYRAIAAHRMEVVRNTGRRPSIDDAKAALGF